MAKRNQLDLVISSLVLIRKASSAIDTALNLPAADRAQLEGNLEAVRTDLGNLMGAVPGASALGTRPELKMAAGVVEFVARHGASQLGVVAGVADTLRSGGDSRTLAQKIERHLDEVGVASREDLARALGLDPGAAKLQEAIERALGSGRAEWYGPGLYGVPRGELEGLVERTPDALEAGGGANGGDGLGIGVGPRDIGGAVARLESSLKGLGAALQETESADRTDAERIRELRRLADDGLISEEQFEVKKAEILAEL